MCSNISYKDIHGSEIYKSEKLEASSFSNRENWLSRSCYVVVMVYSTTIKMLKQYSMH